MNHWTKGKQTRVLILLGLALGGVDVPAAAGM